MGRSEVRTARASDREELAHLREQLWPEVAPEEHLLEIDRVLATGLSGTLAGAILVGQDGEGRLAGFVEVGLRSHADGCDTARTVGFVEGWFVRESCRSSGMGTSLMRAAEEWARGRGCLEMASDTQVENEGSVRAHVALGFEVGDRCVHFRKRL